MIAHSSLERFHLGYADGWTRDMQGFNVLVDGNPCPIVGRVSMDQITVRLPQFYPIGTSVVLIGESGKKLFLQQMWQKNGKPSITRWFV